jgi:hypothetical protein
VSWGQLLSSYYALEWVYNLTSLVIEVLLVLNVRAAAILGFPFYILAFILYAANTFYLCIPSFVYITGPLFLRFVHSESCFFMPCAPQSISETDQAGALFIGLFLFIGVEVAFPLYARLKRRYADYERFRRTVDRRFAGG